MDAAVQIHTQTHATCSLSCREDDVTRSLFFTSSFFMHMHTNQNQSTGPCNHQLHILQTMNVNQSIYIHSIYSKDMYKQVQM